MTSLRRHLSAPGLLSAILQTFQRLPDPRSKAGRISLADALMSGLAVFGLKCPSLLQFDQQRRDPVVEHNLRQLYGVEKVPCDTQLRTLLDPVDPRHLRPAFKAVFAQVQRGKVLEDYVFFQGQLSIDGGRHGLFRLRRRVMSPLLCQAQAKRPHHLPTVRTQDEARIVIEAMCGTLKLLVQLMYGCGLRLMESLEQS